ncbi:MAG: PH domain-containing protein [Corynebacterium sp.]|uniref:PH domain-containing protein n=1 Tax=Corynebacterium TaxID=1716 RepID=UPI00066AAF4F|nr:MULTISPECIES: PH domain-containing protein [Corynebacterium]MDU3165405.1 PH domain-containing protein [Corynebacterium sp.]MDU4406701.1 PH domain-containing protein [Corynebacterium sp.]MDU5327955.1 PH domain-containing protein [Corynebacterium sp.]MDU6417020.1 PH domain-containing protein [Corynebacterium sp.]MDU6592768.1 PH domain-containing protein [Corynebacterium sp.]
MSPQPNFRRVHRLTPLLRLWSVILALIAGFALNANMEALRDIFAFITGEHRGEALRDTALALAGFIAVCAVVWLASGLWWRRMGYQLGAEELSLRRGLLSVQLRTARYDRTQAVDVVEPVIARLFRLAAVRVETAGGQSSVIEIAYLKKSDAEALRDDILARVHGAPTSQTEAPAEESAEEPAEEPALVPEIPIARSLIAAALRTSTLFLVGFLILVVVTRLPLSAALPILVGALPNAWNVLDSSWRYTARTDGEVLNITYGLADRRRQSIRLDRIHAVQITQPFLWRPLGWYEVRVSVAGYGASASGKASGSTRILPVGTLAQARQFLPADAAPTYASPARAKWVSPLDYRQQTVALTGGYVIVRNGRLNRRVKAIHTSHIQELTYRRGPISQALGLATVGLDLVQGPVRMDARNLTLADATALLTQLRSRQLPELKPPR